MPRLKPISVPEDRIARVGSDGKLEASVIPSSIATSASVAAAVTAAGVAYAAADHSHEAINIAALEATTPLVTDSVVIWRDGAPMKASLLEIKTLLFLP